jgi:hypothetical protein
MRNAIALMTLHTDNVGAEAEAEFGRSITAGNPYATGGLTAGLVTICERLLKERQQLTGEDPHEFLQALALEYTGTGGS